MYSEETHDNRESLTKPNYGLWSLLIGIFFWICIGILIIDGYHLNGFFSNGMANMLDNGNGGGWILIVIVGGILPLATHFFGLLFGFIGLLARPRKIAVFGLIVNAILPALLLIGWIYKNLV